MVDVKTTLVLRESTVERLKKYKSTKRESISTLLNRLLDNYGDVDGKK